MTTDTPSDPPSDPNGRKRRWVFWLLLAGALLAVPATLALMLFGPSPPIRVAKETTYLTEPMAEDGLPDYAAALLAEGRKGVTPENNGAIPFLRAMWRPPGGDEAIAETQEQAERLLDALGMKNMPSAEERLTALYSKENKLASIRFLKEKLAPLDDAQRQAVADTFADYRLGSLPMDDIINEDAEAIIKDHGGGWVLDYCCWLQRPWQRAEIPWLGEWCEANKPALAELMAAAERTRWWLPNARDFDAERGHLEGFSMEAGKHIRHLAPAMATYLLWHHGEGRLDESADVAIAMLRLAQHYRSGRLLVHQLNSSTAQQVALSCVRDVVADREMDTGTLRRLLVAVEASDPETPMRSAISHGERLYCLNLVSAVAAGEATAFDIDSEGLESLLASVSIDWNHVLERVNARFDRCDQAMTAPTLKARLAAARSIEAQIEAASQQLAPQSVGQALSLLVSQERRAELAADFIESMMFTSLETCVMVEARLSTHRNLTATVIRLELYRRQHGVYPATLTEAAFGESAIDRFTDEVFAYQRLENTYLLYSVGDNLVDDGGSDASSWPAPTYRGTQLLDPDDPRHGNIPADADDIAVRPPVTYEPFPWEVSVAGADR